MIYLDALEDRTFSLIDFSSETGLLTLAGPVEDLQAVKQEAIGATLKGCTTTARDELVLAIDEITRTQSDPAATDKALDQLDAYRRAAESCENWLEVQAPH